MQAMCHRKSRRAKCKKRLIFSEVQHVRRSVVGVENCFGSAAQVLYLYLYVNFVHHKGVERNFNANPANTRSPYENPILVC